MSDKFNGFSQADIQKLQINTKKPTNAAATMSTTNIKPAFRGGLRRVTEKATTARKPPPIKRNEQLNEAPAAAAQAEFVAGDGDDDDKLDNANLERSMPKSMEDALFFQPMRSSKSTAASGNGNSNSNEIFNGQKATTTEATAFNESSILQLSNNERDQSDSMLEFKDTATLCGAQAAATTAAIFTAKSRAQNQNALNTDSPFKGISLKDFESHRKMIEEQNKQKKELLHKAIEQYSQKTAAEARKIQDIKAELSKLDNDLALDVAILRKQIDMACVHFSNMEKQYMKIETQFLKAKMDLHNAAERKELLTEHLCTVIAHNEDRKAQKLSELMQKVGLSAPDDYFDVKEAKKSAQAAAAAENDK